MSTDTTEAAASPSDAAAPPGLTVSQAADRLAGILAFEDRFKKYVTQQRAEVLEQLVAHKKATGDKTIGVEVDGETAVKFSLNEGKASIEVTNEDDFIGWVLEHHPEKVETVSRVEPTFQAALFKRLKHDADGVRDEDGEPIPGLGHKPAPAEASSFKPTWTGGDAGKEKALSTVLDGGLVEFLALESGADQ